MDAQQSVAGQKKSKETTRDHCLRRVSASIWSMSGRSRAILIESRRKVRDSGMEGCGPAAKGSVRSMRGDTARVSVQAGACRVDKMLLAGVFHFDSGQQSLHSATPFSPHKSDRCSWEETGLRVVGIRKLEVHRGSSLDNLACSPENTLAVVVLSSFFFVTRQTVFVPSARQLE